MPSEPYLTACSMLLYESFGHLPNTSPERRLDIMGTAADGMLATHKEAWRYEDVRDLSFESFVVILNFHRATNYVMPRDIPTVIEKLKD